MRILIVDDEELTRKGMLHTIDWEALGITEIDDADDGINGLALALKKRPNIVLSDIRMPRMNGIEMVEKLKEQLPDSSFIFMSGYSDREYLKAAIKLKAVSYVEKPIDPIEIEEAVLSAIENSEQLKRMRQSEALHSLAKAGRLALSMTYPPKQQDEFTQDSLLEIHPELRRADFFTSVIVKFTGSLSEIPEENLQKIHLKFNDFLSHYNLWELHVMKHDQYLVYHLYAAVKPSERVLLRCCEFLQTVFPSYFPTPFFIAAGETVSGIENAYKSYNTAVILLQSSFFFDYNSILSAHTNDIDYIPAVTDYSAAYMEALLSKSKDRINQIEETIYQNFHNCHTFLPNKVKDVYYKLFITIQNACRSLSLNADATFASSDIILEYVSDCHTLSELHHLLTDKSLSFLSLIETQEPAAPAILAIKDYISHNYHRPALSVKEIGEHIHMSQPYVCTLFKNETGLTLNQYITNYRMEKAKLLLADSNYKIADISAKAGYTDGNYFAKSFRKQTGLSPSEYREKMLL